MPRAGARCAPPDDGILLAGGLRNAYRTSQVIGLDGGMYPR